MLKLSKTQAHGEALIENVNRERAAGALAYQGLPDTLWNAMIDSIRDYFRELDEQERAECVQLSCGEGEI